MLFRLIVTTSATLVALLTGSANAGDDRPLLSRVTRSSNGPDGNQFQSGTLKARFCFSAQGPGELCLPAGSIVAYTSGREHCCTLMSFTSPTVTEMLGFAFAKRKEVTFRGAQIDGTLAKTVNFAGKSISGKVTLNVVDGVVASMEGGRLAAAAVIGEWSVPKGYQSENVDETLFTYQLKPTKRVKAGAKLVSTGVKGVPSEVVEISQYRGSGGIMAVVTLSAKFVVDGTTFKAGEIKWLRPWQMNSGFTTLPPPIGYFGQLDSTVKQGSLAIPAGSLVATCKGAVLAATINGPGLRPPKDPRTHIEIAGIRTKELVGFHTANQPPKLQYVGLWLDQCDERPLLGYDLLPESPCSCKGKPDHIPPVRVTVAGDPFDDSSKKILTDLAAKTCTPCD